MISVKKSRSDLIREKHLSLCITIRRLEFLSFALIETSVQGKEKTFSAPFGKNSPKSNVHEESAKSIQPGFFNEITQSNLLFL